MRQITKNVYSFEEMIALNNRGLVTSKAVDKIRGILQSINADSEKIHEDIIDTDWKPVLEAVGFENPVIGWTGFSNQGDGASFTSDCNLSKLVDWFTKPVEASQVYRETNLLPWLKYKLSNLSTASRFISIDPIEVQKIIPDFEKLKDESGITLKIKRKNNRYYHEHTCELDHDIHSSDDEIYNQTYKKFSEFFIHVENLRLYICKAIYNDLALQNEFLSSDESLIKLDKTNEYHWDIKGNREL